LPQVNLGTIILLAVALLGGAWAAGLFRPQLEDGRLTLRVLRAGRVLASFDFHDTGLLLGLALVMGWAVAAAVERSAWVPSTESRLVPALAVATVLGWLCIVAGVRRLTYLIATLPAALVLLLWFMPTPLNAPGASLAALTKWLQALPDQTNLLLLIGLLLMFVITGLWTSWWIFRRRNGLVALLPTGTILAVEIINDTSPSLVFFSIVWLAAAASLLLRLNFVALKESWRTRRVPHASDTGWTFGEVGIEATVAILALAFIIIPPLSSADISATFIPGVMHADAFHPFGIGAGSSQAATIGSVGYSELVKPGSQLTAKSKTVMLVTGDSPTYYPYWRGIALAGWDGIQWYELPSTENVPVRQQPLLAPHATLPRDDLPAGARLQVLHNTFHVLVPTDQTLSTVFSAGEIISVDNQPSSIRGIMTSVPAPALGSVPALVNVAGDKTATASFDTVDRIRIARRLQPPYNYSITEAIPNVDVADLQAAGTDYPSWLAPYILLYQPQRLDAAHEPQDAKISALAQTIVHNAGASTPYDQAKAIELWFIAKGTGFSYTLTPPKAPPGVRPLDNFLFNSKKGFCQDFSTAMNVMLRTLGIPSRQMSGFSQGVLDEKTRQYFVNAVQAHSWVEVFFPGYGWIPFEPTPDGTNAPINRPQTRDQLSASAPASTDASPGIRPNLREPAGSGAGATTGAAFPDIWRPVLIVAGGLLLLLTILALLALRWLLAVHDVPRIWRRLLFLGDRLGVPRHPGDTPEEFGGRLAAWLPPLDDEVRRLATLYTRASFRHGGLRADELAAARHAWTRVRGSYPSLVAKAWRDALSRGRVVKEEGAASESPSPSRRR
jgi:transglutaminase-like putative cysteine protease